MADPLGDRMKLLERISEAYLIPRLPVLIRVDGKAFHTFTQGMDKPWDHRFVQCMQATARYLCKNISGVRLAYVQSDEITLLLTDWDRFNTQSWFNYRLQKMVSITASMATSAFNGATLSYFQGTRWQGRPALFDARVWNVPPHEVVNAFVWRQQDAQRNSIQMLSRAHFSHKECHQKNTSQLQDMLHDQHGITWDDIPTHLKRGACVAKESSGWALDLEIPLFTQDRSYIEDRLPELFHKER